MSACDITFAFVVWILLIVNRGESTTYFRRFQSGTKIIRNCASQLIVL